MAFRFVILLSALLGCANAGLIASHVAVANPSVDAVAATQQNVVRSFAGTVSHHSKNVVTPYSSVSKSDTRINNNVYTPAVTKSFGLYTQATPVVAKTLVAAPAVYAAPALTKTVSYAAPAVHYAAPAVHYAAPAPVLAKTVSYAAPAVHYAAPAVHYAAPAPVLAKTVSYAAPVATTSYNHGPAATTYTHNAPGVSSYGSAQTVHYSPAEAVSHMSFDGFGTHWGF